MYRQLLKLVFMIKLSVASLVSYGQFTNNLKYWYSLNGKVRSCTTIGYNRIKDTSSKHINSFDSVVFNKKGRLVRSFTSNTLHGQDVNRRFSTIYKYDKKGNLKEITSYDTDGTPQIKDVFTCSIAKTMVTLTRYYLQYGDSSHITDRYKVDRSGRVLKKYHYNESYAPGFKYQYGVTDHIYNAKGLRVEEMYHDLDGVVKWKRLLRYDQYNNMSTSAYLALKDDRQNETLSFSYPAYDKYHNWLVRNRYVNGKFHSVDERTFTYHK